MSASSTWKNMTIIQEEEQWGPPELPVWEKVLENALISWNHPGPGYLDRYAEYSIQTSMHWTESWTECRQMLETRELLLQIQSRCEISDASHSHNQERDQKHRKTHYRATCSGPEL